MSLPVLLPDALRSTESGFALRVSLPWIRSLPLASVADLGVVIDGEPVDVVVALERHRVAPSALVFESGWWFVQNRLVLEGRRMLRPGLRDVSVSFTLAVPYLQAGPAGPLTLPFRADAALALDASAEASGSAPSGTWSRHRILTPDPDASAALIRDERVDPRPAIGEAGWDLGASAFNWTREVIRAERPATDIAVGIVGSGIASTIEVEPGQLWRSFPQPSDAEIDALAARLAGAGGRVSVVGGSLDDWALPVRRRSLEERAAFLEPQLRAAARLGARGVRVPFGQAGGELLRRLQPVLAKLDVVLYEEIQGQQSLDVPGNAENLELLASLDDPRIRVLIDISMLMPALPPSYLEELRAGGVGDALLDRLEDDWRSPQTHAAVLAALRGGEVPPAVHTLFMNLLVRFGRSSVADLEPLLPLTAGVHLKFWDLDDADRRVSRPIADIGAALVRSGFRGTLTSEWGGNEWLGDDPAAMTRAHLALARRALAEASVPSAH
ncbi:sugar phosphate isomerase/epimerase [Microbacterium sp. BK668]|uniref:sugar phosphate isomerase/epimerase n=1 Tax=Microbacterium sp. BK668 TaxID=2512118 RepID=UPI0010DA9B4F|nr:sugar phosphate isomerase/epimerase [Microbacterium sp. BK668]TDN91291.1 xylose isomerase-like TIM barrel protein [Microbacterium sp. BK668]